MADYEIPDGLRYSEEDEWARLEDGRVVVGITDYAQQQLGDIVFVELPEVGATYDKGNPFGVVESVKAVSDLCAPLSGEIVAVNPELVDRPEWFSVECTLGRDGLSRSGTRHHRMRGEHPLGDPTTARPAR